MMTSDRAIGDYALLSDCHGAALVDRSGSIDWMCLPRFDAPAQLARLLDAEGGGHFSLRPAATWQTSRRYLDQTMVLETRFHLEGAELVLTDALAVGPNETGHELGSASPHVLLRELACTQGAVEVDLEYAPRPEYGLIAPVLRQVEGGVLGRGGASVLLLSSPVPLHAEEGVARARFRLERGDRLRFALQYGATIEPTPSAWGQSDIADRLRDTVEAWRSWSEQHQRYDGPWRDLVHHSGRVLQALTYHPTGAIVAAATTSLPEQAGGSRNWDYRYTWVRDASLTLEALWVAACPDEAHQFFDFLAMAALSQLRRGDDMQIMYGIAGEHDLSERELPHLAGWRGSRPVRVGNDAWRQHQLDVYGALLAAADRLADHVEGFTELTRTFLADTADAAARRWGETDHGIWEIRAAPRHYLHSKLMCWVAVDRAIGLAERIDAEDRVPAWRAARDEMRAAILDRGFSDRAGAYTQSFGSDVLDASVLVMPLVGFLPADDPRMLATLDAIEGQLLDARGLVRRYRGEDGLGGEEGAFLLCTFWLAHARALAGQLPAARRLFERAAGCANDIGLLAEEVDSSTGELLGNFPQAYSHIGFVNAAWAIHRAEQAEPEQAEQPAAAPPR